MEFSTHNDLDLILKLEHHGKPIRVSDCVRFAVRVWTQNRNNFLLFTERDVIKGEHTDRLVIAGYQMATLESGVVVYEYSYSNSDRHFRPFEGHNHQDHTKRVVTDIYWKNSNLNQVPSNPVNFQSLNHLRSLIEQEVSDRENAIIDLRDYFNESYIDGLKAEVERSTAKDEELKALIDHNKEIADGCVDALLEKIEAEIKRSNEVDIELFNAIKKAGENTGNIKEETDNKITETNTALDAEVERAKAAEKELSDNIVAEADRAKAAERELNTALTDEVSRAKVKEAELDAKIDSEISRAKVVEGALSDAVDAVRDKANQIAADLASEISRSNQKDNDHTAALNDETTRAKASEKAITDRLDVLEGDKTVVGSVAHAVEDAKHYVDDMIGKVTTDELKDLAEVNNALAAEVSRATTKETELQTALDTLNADENTIGSVAHAESNAKKYADEQIAKTLSDHNTDLSALTSDLASEVSRATTKEAEIDAVLAVVNGDKDTIGSIAHAVEDSKHYTDNQIANLKSETATNLTDTLKPYATKAEVDGRIEGIIGTAPSALDTLGEIADRLAEDNDAITAINGVLSGKANASDVYTKAESDAAHTAITNDLATVNTALSNEVSRAENAEQLITNKVDAVDAKAVKNAEDIATLNTEINGAKNDINGLSNDVLAEISRAQTKEAELESGVSANATKIADLTTRATAVETAVATASSDLTSEINRAKQAETDLSTAITAEASRAAVKEGEIEAKADQNANAIATLDSKIDGVKATADQNATDLTAVKNALDVLNADENTIGSVAHAESDSKHYTDDEIAKVNAKIDAEIVGFATKSEVAAVDTKVDQLKAKVDNLEAPDAYTKAEVDALIEGVDVSDQLVDYAKKSETTCIKDENGNIITEMVIDNSEADDTIEVYTKAQVDEMFASVPKVVTLTQAQYDALNSYAPNTLYIVNG